MTKTQILLGAAAAAMLSTAAFAQDAMTSSMAPPSAQPEQKGGDNIVNPMGSTTMPMSTPAGSMSASSATSMGADASVTASTTVLPAGGTVTVSTVTNGPVPDTAENRALYGQPMSRAGKMTRPAGN